MFDFIPILGIVGGIGSGKSFVAAEFGRQSCVVIASDELSYQAYADPGVRRLLTNLLGGAVVVDDQVDRRAVAKAVFGDATLRTKVEQIVHPWISRRREQIMREAAGATPRPRAFVWDSPLLLETGLDAHCDAVVFVDTPREVRLERVQRSRGWDDAELTRREAAQWPIERKRAAARLVVNGAAPADAVTASVRAILAEVAPPKASAGV
jgi:dephospho-CoA kinase